MPLKIVRNDIIKMQVDAIVNTANPQPTYGTGVDSAVYKAAGEEQLLAARQQIGAMEEGEVAITPGFLLPAKYIIHAVSPCYIDGESKEEEKLRNCYQKSLYLAYQNGCKSIAFPLIATGSYGYPKEEVMRIAVDEINAFLLGHEMLIYLVVFDTTSTRLGLNLYPDLETYIDHNYVCDKREEEYGHRYCGSVRKNDPGYDAYRTEGIRLESQLQSPLNSLARAAMKGNRTSTWADKNVEKSIMPPTFSCANMAEEDYDDFVEQKESAIDERMKHLSDTFQQYLFYLIEQKKLTNVDVYKRAIIDKRQFSKIKNNPLYHPDKGTALRLCVGAMLNLDETKDLLARAGYALSPCDKRDIIFSYFIENRIYDVTEIDIELEERGLPCFIV